MCDTAIRIIRGSRIIEARRNARLNRSVVWRLVVANIGTIWLHWGSNWHVGLRIDKGNVGIEIGKVAGRWASTTSAVFLLMELARAIAVWLSMAMKKRIALNGAGSVPLLVVWDRRYENLTCAWRMLASVSQWDQWKATYLRAYAEPSGQTQLSVEQGE
jgi:hypothetical protein